MQENYINNDSESYEDSINLIELFQAIFNGKWIIISITAFASISSIIYSLHLPDIYKSQALLAPVESSGSMSGALQSYSGLASLAGISMPSAESGDNSVKAMEKISSLSFFKNNLLQIFSSELIAVKSWNSELNNLAFDSNIYNETNNSWNVNFFNTKNGLVLRKVIKNFKNC